MKIMKKIFAFVLIAYLLLSGLYPYQSFAAKSYVKDSSNNEVINDKGTDPKPEEKYEGKWVDLKIRDNIGIIMKDNPRYPSSVNDVKNLMINRPDDHTGWSAKLYACEQFSRWELSGYDKYGNPQYSEVKWTEYVDGPVFNTDDKNREYDAALYNDEIKLNYENNSRHPETLGIDFTGARGTVWGSGIYWSVYQEDARSWPCSAGSESYYYNDNLILMEGRVQIPEPDPTDSKEAPDRDAEGSAKGHAFWELRRYDKNARSGIYIESKFEIAGDHYATRKPKHKVSVNGKTAEQSDGITMEIPDAMPLKGKNLSYEFSYEYTNYYKDIYECTDSEDGHCYSWSFVERIPDWDKVETFTLSDSIKIDHSQEDTVNEDTLDNILSKKWVVGRQDTYSPAKKSKAYYEKYSRAADNKWENHTNLKTQTTLPMTPGKLIYQVELPSEVHKENFYPLKNTQSIGIFKAVDLDESLQSEFKNGVKLQQKVMSDKGMKGDNRTFEGEFVSDLFFTTHFTGFMSGYPYAEKVKVAVVNNASLPNVESVISEGTAKGVADFESYTGQVFKDKWLFTNSEFEKLQRYSIPVTPNSDLKPGETYKNKIELVDMGLNDLKFMFNQSFSFEHYLFGSGYDDAWIIEQPESRFKVDSNEYKTVVLTYNQLKEIRAESKNRSEQKMHNFRFIDRTFPDKVKAIRGTN